MQRIHPKQCVYCHTPFEGKVNSKYCSKSCSFKYEKTRRQIIDLYCDDSHQLSDNLIALVKLGKDYKIGGLEND